jgi:transcriptional regulator with XRE-family HTH domain
MTALYGALQAAGVSQRLIAAKTGQSQSEISEIIAGRRVISVVVLERIVDGLGIARSAVGLAEPERSPEPVAVTGIMLEEVRPRRRQPEPPATPGVARRADDVASRVDVPLWTARDVWALRQALRFGRGEFGKYLGVSLKLISRWEAGILPNPFQQGLLDTALSRLDAAMQGRFARLATEDIGPASQHL